MNARHGGGDEARTDLTFDDNRLLPMLFGDHDRHLARVESTLGVTVSSRGNRVSISGGEGAVEAAAGALRTLYERLQRGENVTARDVDAAVRLGSPRTRDGRRAEPTGEGAPFVTRKRTISPQTSAQAAYMDALRASEMSFSVGPAGTGKTYLAVAAAVEMMMQGAVDRIILSRPAVEAGERLGFLPGDLREKVDPYLRPLYDALYDMLPGDEVMRKLGNGEIEIAPLAFMRGRTLSHAFVILDEAQNTTPVQMKMFLTRFGEGSRMVVTGDLSQVDLPGGGPSGLRDAIGVLSDVEEIAVVRFTNADVVRHHLVTRIVSAYEAQEGKAGARE